MIHTCARESQTPIPAGSLNTATDTFQAYTAVPRVQDAPVTARESAKKTFDHGFTPSNVNS
jgi:hypothetical protein